MRSVYRVFAYLIAAAVAIQAASIAFAVFGLVSWIEGGGTLDKAAIESDSTHFAGDAGFMWHGIGGTMVIPLLALLLLIFSFFAKVPGGVKWALYVLVAVIVQVGLGIFAHSVSGLGALHGIVALGLFAVAFMTGHRVRSTSVATERADAVPTASR
jgi:hypothetical protein